MRFRYLLLGHEHDAGGCIVTPFRIRRGRESQAGREILMCLADGMDFSLPNDLDEGGEGTTSFRRTRCGMVKHVGGHGWQSEWESVDEVEVLAAVAELAIYRNRRGSLIRYKQFH